MNRDPLPGRVELPLKVGSHCFGGAYGLEQPVIPRPRGLRTERVAMRSQVPQPSRGGDGVVFAEHLAGVLNDGVAEFGCLLPVRLKHASPQKGHAGLLGFPQVRLQACTDPEPDISNARLDHVGMTSTHGRRIALKQRWVLLEKRLIVGKLGLPHHEPPPIGVVDRQCIDSVHDPHLQCRRSVFVGNRRVAPGANAPEADGGTDGIGVSGLVDGLQEVHRVAPRLSRSLTISEVRQRPGLNGPRSVQRIAERQGDLGRSACRRDVPALVIVRDVASRYGLQAVAAGDVAHDDQGRHISAARGAAKVALALGDALYRAGAIQAGALPNLADREAPRQAWRNTMHLLEAIDESGHPDAIRAAIRLWSVRTGRDPSVPDEHAAATLEMWIVDRVDALPVDDPDRWRFVMRQAELADYESLLKQYPPLLERYAAAMGARHPDVVKARIRNVRFRVGAGLETHLRETKQSGVPFLRGSVLQAHWEQTAELSHAVVQDACQVFGEDHSVTTSARLWDLAAHGHAFGAEAARPRYDRLLQAVSTAEAMTSDFQRQLDATWQGITVHPIQGIWWGP